MTTELQTTPIQPVVVKDQNLELTATNPKEMVECQQGAIEWCTRKLKLAIQERDELKEEFQIAQKNKWRSLALHRHWQLGIKRVQFYEKIQAALKSGYYIIPSFDAQIIVIRTDSAKPSKMISVTTYSSVNKEQDSKMLPLGQGDYKNPEPEQRQRTLKSFDEKGKPVLKYETWADHWKDIEFPLNMARPQIMRATSEAMALKIFDEIGVLPDYRRKADPVILGRIYKPQAVVPKRNWESISFLIAWHLRTESL